MTLENIVAANMILGVNTAIGAAGAIDFYTATGDIPATGMLNTTGRLRLSSTPIGTTATNSNVGTFTAITSNTVKVSGTVAFFAILSSTTGVITTATWVRLTGSVGTDTGDITFNTTVWDVNDNVSITSLTFTQPLA